MNDVAIVKEGWLHKRGQCPRGRPGARVPSGPAAPQWPGAAWAVAARRVRPPWAPGPSWTSPGALWGPMSPWPGGHGLAGPPGWGRVPWAGVQPVEWLSGWGRGREEPPAFLEGSEDTGAGPRPGALAARGAARGLLRAEQGCLAWPGASLGPGCRREGAPCHPVARLGAGLCWSCRAGWPGAPSASPLLTHVALCPGRGSVRSWWDGSVGLGPSPSGPACPTALCCLAAGGGGLDRPPVQVPG